MGKLKLLQDIFIFDRDFASEGRISHDNIEILQRSMVTNIRLRNTKGFSKFCPKLIAPLMRREQRVCLKNIAASVVVHNHVHFCCFDEIGVDIKAEIVMCGHVGNAVLEGTN